MSTDAALAIKPVTFTPGMQLQDVLANYWLRQATIRLRREIAWLWHEQGVAPHTKPEQIPPIQDKLAASLNLQRFWQKKQEFFSSDPTARYLSEQLLESPPPVDPRVLPGTFSWLMQTLDLRNVDALALALALLVQVDNATGNVIAACLNDAAKTHPTIGLVQRLWDAHEQVMPLTDPAHPLFHFGLLQIPTPLYPEWRLEWDRPLLVAPLVARHLLGMAEESSQGLTAISPEPPEPGILTEELDMLIRRLQRSPERRIQFIPIKAPQGGAFLEMLQTISSRRRTRILRWQGDPNLLRNKNFLDALAVCCWLQDADLYIDHEQLQLLLADKRQLDLELMPKVTIPIQVFLGVTEQQWLSKLPGRFLLPMVTVPEFKYADRLAFWRSRLGETMVVEPSVLSECARRFRFQRDAIRRVCEGLRNSHAPLSKEHLLSACRSEIDLDLGDLAQPVTPRFLAEDLILPAKQSGQFREILQAITSLTEVHYEWGTERAWNESGIAVLFAGAPGTGKTMAAEIIARQQNLPMFRIDLSQVVNKYIGETEKNLKRVFDMADQCDTILFFDEADSLFGKRSEVKDAHDRYANLEISYLLERMERFKGLAILATNRKKDLDEAFLRRLRYIIDFPLPEVLEREKIWRQVIPPAVDATGLDFHFLASKFALAGGHIRSIVFNACLQSAGKKISATGKYRGILGMEAVMVAVRREYEKINRSVSMEQFGPYARLIETMEGTNGASSH